LVIETVLGTGHWQPLRLGIRMLTPVMIAYNVYQYAVFCGEGYSNRITIEMIHQLPREDT
jgi:hypothetical protein